MLGAGWLSTDVASPTTPLLFLQADTSGDLDDLHQDVMGILKMLILLHQTGLMHMVHKSLLRIQRENSPPWPAQASDLCCFPPRRYGSDHV